MGQARRRISYVIPPPTGYVSRLQLPPHGVQRLGAVEPLLTPFNAQSAQTEETQSRVRHPRHRLGVSSLALDTSTSLASHSTPEGILYSGGRDGLIIGWDLGIPMKRRKAKANGGNLRNRQRWEMMTGWADNTIEEEGEDGEDRLASDGDILGEVTSSLNVKRQRAASMAGELTYEQEWETDLGLFSSGKPSEFRQCAQAHSDWVNDILLCNYNQTVISASSDGTVKAWNPHSSTPLDPSIIGSHSDYVRCLALCREQNWVASGSFDRSIKLWDLSRTAQASPTSDPLITLNSADATAPKSSVYALAADPLGHTIASGSPERVIRLWDARTGKRTAKLVGHTDNIRAILVSEDSKYLLTGSADASIKLWSLASQRCLHTFAHHTDSVWSLYSSHPTLETFYSGDRSGFVCRVDVEGCGDLSDGECILLCNDAGDPMRSSSEGINKLIVMDDNLVWTASGTSTIKRWHIPQPRATRTQHTLTDADGEKLPLSQSPSPFKRRMPPGNDVASEASTRPSTGHGQPRRMSSAPSMQSLFSDNMRDRDSENKLNGIPLDSLVKLLSPHDPFASFTSNRARDPEVATLYSAASVMSVPRGTARFQSQSIFQHSHTSPLLSSKTEETVVPANIARANYEERELAADATPLCAEPDDILPGDHGLVRSVILNDRIHTLTVDTAGEVAIWDIARGICLGRYPPEDVAAASHAGSVAGGSGDGERSPREALEIVRERIEGEAVVSTWCTADTKAGVLAIHLTERCFEAEVYADEVGFAHDAHFNDDSKLNIGKWVLRNLFLGFIREEVHIRRNSSDGVLPPSISRAEGGPGSPSRKSRHRSSSSPESPRKLPRHAPMSSTVVYSPKMIPAISPTVTTSGFQRFSPLIAPLIPLQLTKEPLPTIPQSTLGNQDTIPPSSFHQRSRSGTVDGPITRTPSSNPSKEDYFTTRVRQTSVHEGVPSSPDDFSGWAGPGKTEPTTPSTPSGLMGRLKNLGKITKRPVSDTTSPTIGSATPVVENRALTENVLPDVPKTPLQKLLSDDLNPPTTADAPTHMFPPQTVILISEEATPSYRIIYRGNVATTHHDLAVLEEMVPMWLAEYLLVNRVPPIAPLVKLSFVLLPWNRDHDVEPLPELLNTTQSKLTASRYLRISKIVQHVQGKLEKVTAESRAASIRSSVDSYEPHPAVLRAKAEDMYEILCNDALLPLHMTLAAVRQYVWRQSSELVMHYRRKPVQPLHPPEKLL